MWKLRKGNTQNKKKEKNIDFSTIKSVFFICKICKKECLDFIKTPFLHSLAIFCCHCNQELKTDNSQKYIMCFKCSNFIHEKCIDLHSQHELYVNSREIFSNTKPKYSFSNETLKKDPENKKLFNYVKNKLDVCIHDITIVKKTYDPNVIKLNKKKTCLYTIDTFMDQLYISDLSMQNMIFTQSINLCHKNILGYTDLGPGIFLVYHSRIEGKENEIFYSEYNNNKTGLILYKMPNNSVKNESTLCLININNQAIYLIPQHNCKFEKYIISTNKWQFIPEIDKWQLKIVAAGQCNSHIIYCILNQYKISLFDTLDEENGWIHYPITCDGISIFHISTTLQCSQTELIFFGITSEWLKFNFYNGRCDKLLHRNLEIRFFSKTMFIKSNYVYSFLNTSFSAYCIWRQKIYLKKLSQCDN